MTIAVGTKNPAKIKAVQSVVKDLDVELISLDVASDVSPQPISDLETKTGALNRARHCLEQSEAHLGIGLEGGVMTVEEDMYLTNWGAIVDREGHEISASGARFKLPTSLVKGIQSGKELGEVIDEYAMGHDIRKNEGTVGILTNGYVTRDTMFEQVVRILIGQYSYSYKLF